MIARHGRLHDPKLKPKIRGDYCTWNCWLSFVFNLVTASSSSNSLTRTGSALFAQVQFIDQFFITIGFCFAQIIEQTPAMRDHLKQTASRRVILPVDLKVFG